MDIARPAKLTNISRTCLMDGVVSGGSWVKRAGSDGPMVPDKLLDDRVRGLCTY